MHRRMHSRSLTITFMFLAASLSNLACAGDAPAPITADTPPAPTPAATPAATVAATATATAEAPAPTEQPCPPEPPGRVREGAGVLNASPDDLPVELPAGGKTPARPKLKFDDAKGAAAKPTGAFALWHDQGVWHLHATGKGAKADTLYQARVSLVSNVTAENAAAGLRVIDHPRQTPGRCWNDPPKSDPTHSQAGFDLTWDGKARGISFKVPDQACFTVTLRVAKKQELPPVTLGANGKPPKVDKGQDTIELCP